VRSTSCAELFEPASQAEQFHFGVESRPLLQAAGIQPNITAPGGASDQRRPPALRARPPPGARSQLLGTLGAGIFLLPSPPFGHS
jgi:hypothetical protein